MNKRGIVLTPPDFSGVDWKAGLAELRLNTLGVHSGGGANHDVLRQLGATASEEFRRDFRSAGIECEYEIHAAASLLPVSLFESRPEYFALSFREENRSATANWCVTNPDVPAILAANAGRLAEKLRSTTHRYYFWGADREDAYCHCRECSKYTASELNLLGVNAIADGIRRVDPLAEVACLAYLGCYEVPERVEPRENVFLEFAPYVRCYHHALNDPACAVNRRFFNAFRELGAFFGMRNTHILEYWLDSSLFSGYRKPARRPFVRPELLRRDLEAYAGAGIRNITSFAVYMDGEYFSAHGTAALEDYAAALREFLPDDGSVPGAGAVRPDSENQVPCY